MSNNNNNNDLINIPNPFLAISLANTMALPVSYESSSDLSSFSPPDSSQMTSSLLRNLGVQFKILATMDKEQEKLRRTQQEHLDLHQLTQQLKEAEEKSRRDRLQQMVYSNRGDLYQEGKNYHIPRLNGASVYSHPPSSSSSSSSSSKTSTSSSSSSSYKQMDSLAEKTSKRLGDDVQTQLKQQQQANQMNTYTTPQMEQSALLFGTVYPNSNGTMNGMNQMMYPPYGYPPNVINQDTANTNTTTIANVSTTPSTTSTPNGSSSSSSKPNTTTTTSKENIMNQQPQQQQPRTLVPSSTFVQPQYIHELSEISSRIISFLLWIVWALIMIHAIVNIDFDYPGSRLVFLLGIVSMLMGAAFWLKIRLYTIVLDRLRWWLQAILSVCVVLLAIPLWPIFTMIGGPVFGWTMTIVILAMMIYSGLLDINQNMMNVQNYITSTESNNDR